MPIDFKQRFFFLTYVAKTAANAANTANSCLSY